MSRIEFLESTHQYLLDGVAIPSVSAIIKDDSYDNIPPEVLERASYRGTRIHTATEMIDQNKKFEIEDEFALYLVQYMLFQKQHNFRWTAIEQIVYTEDYAGTVDRIHGNYKEKILIADVKSTYRIYKDKLALQLAGYIMAHAYMYGNKLEDYIGAVIWLSKAKWKFQEIEPDFDGFNERLAIYKHEHETMNNVTLDDILGG